MLLAPQFYDFFLQRAMKKTRCVCITVWVGEGILFSRTLALAEPLTTLPRSARSRVQLVAK